MQKLILKAIRQDVTPLVKHTDPDMLAFNPYVKDGSLTIIRYSTDEKKGFAGIS